MTSSTSSNRNWKKFVIPIVTFFAGAVIVLIPCVIVIVRNSKSESSSSISTSTSTSTSPPTTWNESDYQSNSEYYKNFGDKTLMFNQEHNLRLDRLSSPRFRPSDGSSIIYLRRQYHMPDSNGSTTTLHWTKFNMVSIEKSIQLTRPIWGIQDQQFYWIDEKTVLFLSNRAKSGLTQVFQLNLPDVIENLTDFIEPIQLTDYPLNIDNLLVNRQATRLAFSCQVYSNLSIEETADRQTTEKLSKIVVNRFDKLFVRHWDTYMTGLRHHPFIVKIDRNDKGIFNVSPTPRDILFGIDSDAPTRPFGDANNEWSFSASGNMFAFTRQYDETSAVAWSTNLDIFTINVSSVDSRPQCITCENPAADTNPKYSPIEENVLVYRAQAKPTYESDQFKLKWYYASSPKRTLLDEWNFSIESFTWSTDGESLFVELPEKAINTLYQVYDLKSQTQTTKRLTDVGTTQDVNIHPKNNNIVLFTHSNIASPPNIYFMNLNNSVNKSITIHNDNLLRSVILSTSREQYSFLGARNETVYGWHVPPANGITSKAPLAFLIHGGPQSSWDDAWGFRWNFQVYTGQGYAVIAINFHGSDSYGQAFTDSIIGQYGTLPYEDLKLGLDAALQKYSYIDRNRIAALGASFGCYMINWIAGHPEMSQRFKTFVCHDGVLDVRIKGYNTEELWFTEHDVGGFTQFDNPEVYERYNPVKHVANWTQPMLIIHGALDYRVPETQGISTFTALQRRNISSRLLFFPTENHWVSNPLHSIIWHDEVLKWIGRWTS